MISLILAFIFFVLFVFFCIAGGNYLLRSMIDNVLSKNKVENFSNLDELIVRPEDECKKIDALSQNNLNFQTGTNIPLSSNYYKNFVGSIYIDDDLNNKNSYNPLGKGKYFLKKNKLLYDGIWDSDIKNDSPYEIQEWKLTNGDLTDGYYCSNKLLEINKPIPDNFIDKSATPPPTPTDYYVYFNDTIDDVFDKELICFPSVFNAGMTEDLRKKFE